MDITARLDNDVARYVHKFSEEDAVTLLPEIFTYEFKTAGELRAERSETSYDNAGFRDENYDDVDVMDVPTMSYEAVNKLNRDPARVIMSRDKLVTQDDALHGTIRSRKTEEDIFTSKVIRTLRRDLTVISNDQTLDSMDDDELVPVRVKKHKRFVTVRRSFRLRRKQLKNKNSFNVVLELLDREGAIVQRETVSVNHRKLLQDYFIPRRAPIIRLSSSRPGVNILQVAQRDKKASGVKVYKRVLNDSKPLINSPYSLVGTYRLRKRGRRRGRSRFLRIYDKGPNSNPVIYRVVPVRGKEVFPLFKTIVVPAVTLRNEVKVTKNKFSTMSLRATNTGTEIQIRKFDMNASFMSILRRDLTAREKNFRMLSKGLLPGTGAWRTITGDTMSFTDRNVQDGRVYEYQTRVMYKDGTVMVLIGSTFIEYVFPTDEVTFNVTKPRITRGRRSANCTFKIVVNTENKDGKPNQSELLKDFLNASGTEKFYATPEQMQELRDDTAEIVVFSIERLNLTTGEREMFNIFNPAAGSTFNDTRMSRSSNISKLSAGNLYRYIVRAHKVSPSDLLKSASVSKVDSRTGRSYKTKTAKSRSRRALRTGTVLPSRSRYRVTGRNAIFNLGKTGSSHVIDADLSGALPEITRSNVEKISRRENVLSWTVRGDTSKIDHFIIMIEKRKSTIPIFVAQAIPNMLEYEYVDTFTARIRGPIEFKILAVYLDYTRGEPESMGTIISSGIANKRRRQGK